MLSFSDWQEKADQVHIPQQAIIDGKHCNSTSGDTFDCISPIDGRVLAKVASCGPEDAELAVSNARAAFNKGTWSELAPAERKKILLQFASLVAVHKEELALLETLDMGKPISDAMEVDAEEVIDCIAWHAEAIDKLYDEIAPTGSDTLGLIQREPLGVIAAIVPWNFPMAMATWKLAPALATGNSVILKPSEKSPLTAIRLAELALEAGIPAGVFNVVPGFGATIGDALAKHMDVDGLVFTGSTRIGKQLLSVAALSNMKRTYVECGGKSPNIIFDDCPNIQDTAKAACDAIFFNQGEVCTAGSRLLIQESIAEEFIDALRVASKELKQGHPLDPDTQMGALVDDAHMTTVIDYINTAHEDNATLILGGKSPQVIDGGSYVEPTIFKVTDSSTRIYREEIFGPVLTIMTFKTEEQAINMANDTNYGLGAGLWTTNINRAHRVAKKIKSGSVWVNCYDQGDMTVPFGGFKQSGNGRDKSLHAFDKYTELKTTWIKLENQ